MYKRLVIYLYYYKNGEKKKNCGYAKMNISNGECRMEINVKDISQMEGSLSLYFLKNENGRLKGKKVMDIEKQESVLNLKYICKCSNMADGLSIDEMQGILIYDGANLMKSVCGGLGEGDINILDFAGEEKNLEIAGVEGDSEKKNSIISEETDNSVYEYDEECLKKKAENSQADCTEDNNIEGCSMTLNDKENARVVPVSSWQEKMFHVFPKIIMNINGEKTIGIKLKPHDIVWFPGSYWRLATNQFLLNGYYNYRYILFFKGTGEQEGKYFLGTPGCFGVNDAVTAKKFGFTDFFMADRKSGEEKYLNRNDGRNFGFWCREA